MVESIRSEASKAPPAKSLPRITSNPAGMTGSEGPKLGMGKPVNYTQEKPTQTRDISSDGTVTYQVGARLDSGTNMSYKPLSAPTPLKGVAAELKGKHIDVSV